MIHYREEIGATEEFRQQYVDGFERLIQQRQRDAELKRIAACQSIFSEQEAHREKFKRILGWPLVGHRDEGLPSVRATKLADEAEYSIYRMSFEILEGLELTGLYFEKHGEEARPLVLVQHGGAGTPELISGMYGDTENYNHMLERVIAHGVHAFAPQLLLWRDAYGVPQNRRAVDARLKRLGSSITAVELYGLSRILDYFETRENISTFGMVGLSYGGFYTLFMAAIDTRIRSAISCGFFNTRDQYPWMDWTWFGAAEHFDDAEIACLVYPRKLCIEIATRDEIFDAEYGIQSFEALKELCKDVGCDWVKFIVFEGVHEFCHDDAPIAALVEDLLS